MPRRSPTSTTVRNAVLGAGLLAVLAGVWLTRTPPLPDHYWEVELTVAGMH